MAVQMLREATRGTTPEDSKHRLWILKLLVHFISLKARLLHREIIA